MIYKIIKKYSPESKYSDDFQIYETWGINNDVEFYISTPDSFATIILTGAEMLELVESLNKWVNKESEK